MKKKKLALFLLVVLCAAQLFSLSAAGYSYYDYAYDATDLLDPEYMEHFGTITLPERSEEMNIEMRLDVISDTEGHTIEEYAEIFYDKYQYGLSLSGGGVLLMLNLQPDDTGLAYHGGAVYCGPDTLNGEEIQAYLTDLLSPWFSPSVWSGTLEKDQLVAEKLLDSYVDGMYAYLQNGLADADVPYFDLDEGSDSAFLHAPYVGTDAYALDYAGILSADEVQELDEIARAMTEEYFCDCRIVTVANDLDYDYDTVEAAKSIFKDSGFGYGSDGDAIMLFLSMANRQYALIAHGSFGNYAFTDYGKDALAVDFLDDFAEDDWYGGFKDYLISSARFMQKARAGEPVDIPEHPALTTRQILVRVLVMILVPSIIALIVCFALKSQLNTVHKGSAARNYVVPGSDEITQRQDYYTHSTETRTKIERSSSSSSSSGGSSGGTSVDSGGFSSKSGSF